LRGLARLFLKLGTLGFGGPAAHIALMQEEVVQRRGWMSQSEFLDSVGAVNLLPGPNSTELAIEIGRRRAGGWGLLVAGLCFILPATLLVLGCAWAYVRFGHLPALQGLWRGVKPVVVAVVGVALAGFARTAVRSSTLALTAVVALVLTAVGVHELLVLLLSGVLILAAGQGGWARARMLVLLPWVPAGLQSAQEPGPGLTWLFLFFLKIGAVLYGSGYVLLSFLRGGLVERGHWLTEAQLLDAIAVGQITPGPVFTTATFVGFLLHGVTGGLVATVGIFLPAFLLVGATGSILPWVQRSPSARAFLDGVNVGALALMAVVTWQLGRTAIDSPATAGLGLAALALLWLRVNSAWLIAGGALGGLLFF
jgi:chromate transporter